MAETQNRIGSESEDVTALREFEGLARPFVVASAERLELSDADRMTAGQIGCCAYEAEAAMDRSWREFKQRVEFSFGGPPDFAQNLVPLTRRFLAVVEEVAPIGSARVPIARLPEGRIAIAACGEELLAHTGRCITASSDRERRSREWQQRRFDFVEQIYACPETADLMRALDTLEATLPKLGLVTTTGATSDDLRAMLARVLQLVVLAVMKTGRTFAFDGLPLDTQRPVNDFFTMLREWKAAASQNHHSRGGG